MIGPHLGNLSWYFICTTPQHVPKDPHDENLGLRFSDISKFKSFLGDEILGVSGGGSLGAWVFSVVFSQEGETLMTLGYTERYLSAKSPDKVALYAAQSLFIILPPSLYAATMYMIYGRIVLFVNNPSASLIRPTRVTKIFVCGDVVAFLLQAGGGGMMTSAGNASLGQKVIIGGLIFQLLFFGFFLVIALTFRRRMNNSPFSSTINSSYTKHTWQSLLRLLLIGAALIIGRCLFRVAEFGMGMDGFLMSKEAFMYIGDTMPMLIVQVMFHIVHAGNVFTSEFVAAKGVVSESYVQLNERR
ncbi:hypothetical protein G7Y89_g8765 [Cudoniella acicularis]|uniref:Uncharacterized protein n=1 Tax=Cudoniella acicularis TaxID=354080 RepID=A0A8H4W0R6_9HELO|nr:hypothetical protein G7Y89_g8765 [Cudoniella acicularis]